MNHKHASIRSARHAPTGPELSYLPGMGRDWLLPLYDPITRLLRLRSAHRRLSDQAALRPNDRVLEIGCGTANLALLVKQRHPSTEVVGLDPDPKALARAARKARRGRFDVRFNRGFAGALPYPDASFDRVLSAFMFHHLELPEKQRALREVARVLRPGGTLHLLDFGGRRDPSDGLLTRIAHHNRHLQDNLGDRIPTLMGEAGLADPVETGHRVTVVGRYTFYRATR
jgi:ubiquinone/menaquinone biosynthesis C-methylase UbiE